MKSAAIIIVVVLSAAAFIAFQHSQQRGLEVRLQIIETLLLDADKHRFREGEGRGKRVEFPA